jgi:hypothetical protein
MKTYTIDTALISRFEEKLISFKKKFAKYGNGSVIYTVSLPYAIKHSDHSEQLVVDISVDASYQISGYSFIALLERTPNGNVIKTASDDVKVPEIYRDRYECEHCKSHRDRKYTVILKNDETGEWEKVASYRHKPSDYPFGHGVTSLYMAEKLFKFSLEQALAIRWHMSVYDVSDYERSDLFDANEKYPMCMLIQMADQLSIL